MKSVACQLEGQWLLGPFLLGLLDELQEGALVGIPGLGWPGTDFLCKAAGASSQMSLG